jgi:hypothetical protein
MASVRGILNIQSLNELTYENAPCRCRVWSRLPISVLDSWNCCGSEGGEAGLDEVEIRKSGPRSTYRGKCEADCKRNTQEPDRAICV